MKFQPSLLMWLIYVTFKRAAFIDCSLEYIWSGLLVALPDGSDRAEPAQGQHTLEPISQMQWVIVAKIPWQHTCLVFSSTFLQWFSSNVYIFQCGKKDADGYMLVYSSHSVCLKFYCVLIHRRGTHWCNFDVAASLQHTLTIQEIQS